MVELIFLFNGEKEPILFLQCYTLNEELSHGDHLAF